MAAFFAFAPRHSEHCEHIALYAYVEHYGRGKGWFEDDPRIIGLGPYAITHERHYAQQSEYTICKKRVGDEYLYWAHEEALDREEDEQDLLTKYVIPASERDRFLGKLDLMNINAYSLFRDEGSLMQTLAYRQNRTARPLTMAETDARRRRSPKTLGRTQCHPGVAHCNHGASESAREP